MEGPRAKAAAGARGGPRGKGGVVFVIARSVCVLVTRRGAQRAPMDFLFGKKKQEPKKEPGAEMQEAVTKMREVRGASLR